MMTSEQAEMLRRTIQGVRFSDLTEREADMLRWLIAKPRGYCSADVQRDLEAIFATQDGLCALATYDHEKIMEKRKKLDRWYQVLLLVIGALIGQLVELLFSALL